MKPSVLPFTIALAASCYALPTTPLESRSVLDSDRNVLLYSLAYAEAKVAFYQLSQSKTNSLYLDQENWAKLGMSKASFANWTDLIHAATSEAMNLSKTAVAGEIPALSCNYDFDSIRNLDQYLQVAVQLEDIGVFTYAGNTVLFDSLKRVISLTAPLIGLRRIVSLTAPLFGLRSIVSLTAPLFGLSASTNSTALLSVNNLISPKGAYSALAPYVVQCSSGDAVLEAFPEISVTNLPRWKAGHTSTLHMQLPRSLVIPTGPLYLAYTTKPYQFTQAIIDRSTNNITVKDFTGSSTGQTYIVLTSSKVPVNETTIVAGPVFV